MLLNFKAVIFKKYIFILNLLVLFISLANISANAQMQESISIYGILADNPTFDTKNKNFSAQGHVSLLTSDGFFSGDKAISKDAGTLITLEGDVIIIRSNELIKASRLVLDRNTGEMILTDVEIISDPFINLSQTVNLQLLKFTEAELAFAVKQKNALDNLKKDLFDLREEYANNRNLLNIRYPGSEKKLNLIEKSYATNLERYLRTKYQGNMVLEAMPEAEKTRIEARREAINDFLTSHPEINTKMQQIFESPGFTKLVADRLVKTRSSEYKFTNATITPCKCAENDPPIYSIGTKFGTIIPDNYALLQGSTINIANFPIIYTPFLIFPVKTRRQSGFLRPYIYLSRNSNVVGIPYYQTFGDHADATLTINKFSNRGYRLDSEVRLAISAESNLRLYGEFINDKKYNAEITKMENSLTKQITDKKNELENSATLSDKVNIETEISDLESQKSSLNKKRWFMQGSINLPITAWGSIKADGEFVSDNKYLSDFSKDDISTPGLSLLSPPASAKRFLVQESALEYYGEQLVFSGRLQGVQDLFFLEKKNTPVRLPRLEFYLLPKRYFDLPIAFGSSLSWERIHRLGGSSFIDQESSATQADRKKNGKKDSTEPFIEGDRLATNSSLVFPLPANNYINSNLSLQLKTTNYTFPATYENNKQKANQAHITYAIDSNLPLYSEFIFYSPKENTALGKIHHDFIPTVQLRYIPEVIRSANFPIERQLFYLEDSVLSTQDIRFTLSSNWYLSKAGFEATPNTFKRLPPEQDSGVANEQIAKEFLNIYDATNPSYNEIYSLLNKYSFTDAYTKWANKELIGYSDSIRKVENSSSYVWPTGNFFRQNESWRMNPINLSISTGYNLRYKESENELNKKEGWQPGTPWKTINPWSDVSFLSSLSLSPLSPIAGQVQLDWNTLWKRLAKKAASVSITLPWGISANSGISDTYTITTPDITQDSQYNYSITAQPLDWLSFNHSWARQTKTINGILVKDINFADNEFRYSNSQTLSIINLQDCLDIVIKRFKDFPKREYEALWSIGLNMTFFGTKSGSIDIGGPLNKKIAEYKNQN